MTDIVGGVASIIQGMDRIVSELATDSGMATCSILRPHPLMVIVRQDSRMVLIGPASLWEHGRDLLSPYLARCSAGDAMLVLLGEVSRLELDVAVNKGLAALLSWEPSAQSLTVAVRAAFDAMDLRSRAESRGKWLNRYRFELGEIVEIARAMTTQRETDTLLGVILEKARFITGADAGSLYVVEGDDPDIRRRVLRFKLTQNESVHFDWSEFTVPISHQSIAGAAALTGKPINIADVYDLPPRSPFVVDPSFDKKIGYRTRSVLCAPLVCKDGDVIGVLQLINRKRDARRKLLSADEFETQVVPFDERSEELVTALAAQAGVCLENAILYEEIRDIFDGFVRASVEAIEQRDPSTSGHSRRVAHLSVALARCVDETNCGSFRDVRFTEQDLRELKYASLLHDFGKIGVREEVLVKAKKLYDAELRAVRARFDCALKDAECTAFRQRIEALEQGLKAASPDSQKAALDVRKKWLEEAWRLVLAANEPTGITQTELAQLEEVAATTYADSDGQLLRLLTDTDLERLKISRGSLTADEMEEMRGHVQHTWRFLERIPWGGSFRRIPAIAAAHHERPDGTGYPRRLRAEEIPLQAKIMSIADIFDALTSSDRPYKRVVPVDRAMKILESEAVARHLDPELVQIFCRTKPWEKADAASVSVRTPGQT